MNGGAGFAGNAPLGILVVCDARSYTLPIERHTPYLDGAAAIENMLLAGSALGIEGTWLNWGTSKASEELIRKELKIPDYCLPVSMVVLGYPAVKVGTPARKKIEEVMFIDEFFGQN